MKGGGNCCQRPLEGRGQESAQGASQQLITFQRLPSSCSVRPEVIPCDRREVRGERGSQEIGCPRTARGHIRNCQQGFLRGNLRIGQNRQKNARRGRPPLEGTNCLESLRLWHSSSVPCPAFQGPGPRPIPKSAFSSPTSHQSPTPTPPDVNAICL